MKAAVRVLDSYSVITYIENEPGANTIIEAFQSARDSDKPLFLSVVNWGEVYYIIHRETSKDRADEVVNLIASLPVVIVPADADQTRQAALFKATKRMSYANCFAAALAKLRKAELITGDKAFKNVEGDIKVFWL
jgi:predicted nucleic acid-binding protein